MSTTGSGVRLAKSGECRALGRAKFKCPSCGSYSFVPYIFEDSKQAIDKEECGRCDHEGSCGYHRPPREYWEIHPDRKPEGMTPEDLKKNERERRKRLEWERLHLERQKLLGTAPEMPLKAQETPQDEAGRIKWEFVRPYERKAQETPLFRFMCKLWAPDRVEEVFRLYHVGCYDDGKVIFWQIDNEGGVRTGKVMQYREDGHRAKGPDGGHLPGSFDWVHSILKRRGMLPESWNLEQCLFGAHLLTLDDLPVPVHLVESEKTALMAACEWPESIWLATGSKNNLKPDKLAALREYCEQAGPLTVWPDLGAEEEWKAQLKKSALWLPIRFSTFLEEVATDKAKAKGYDLGDYLAGEF